MVRMNHSFAYVRSRDFGLEIRRFSIVLTCALSFIEGPYSVVEALKSLMVLAPNAASENKHILTGECRLPHQPFLGSRVGTTTRFPIRNDGLTSTSTLHALYRR